MNRGILFEEIRQKVFELRNENTVIIYKNKGNNKHEIVIRYEEEIEHDVNDYVIKEQ
ncbi:hypothetical protein [Mammaliicoccus sciuri]|uniref:hypothetical protein n=1 Tax=Mammaliicoccus sciuri TaxID=1296 RepID=UPI0021D34964|nr:hypothetical protein [Mammaliicoccus sciuri]UXV29991.1 hypothetical protein MUA76_03000 [Mammaliicoccus sciuri]